MSPHSLLIVEEKALLQVPALGHLGQAKGQGEGRGGERGRLVQS